MGKIPPKHRNQTARYTFLKLEWHGTRHAGGPLIGHVFDFIKAAKARERKRRISAKSMRTSMSCQVLSIWCTQQFLHRRHACLLDTPLSMAEIKLRATILGLSFMHNTAHRIRAQTVSVIEQVGQNIHMRHVRTSSTLPVGEIEQCKVESSDLLVKLRKIQDIADTFLADINSDPSLDHLDVRFGHEVIFDCDELITAMHLPGETELAVQMGVFQLAKIITEAMCGSSDRDR